MFQNNLLLAELKRQLNRAAPRVEGIVKAHERGFGSLELDNKKSYFIPVSKMKRLLHGDRVKGTIDVQGNKKQFEPETIIKSALTQFIGTVEYLNSSLVVYPYHPIIKRAIPCKVSKTITTKLYTGQWVIAKLTSRSLQQHQTFFAEITECLAAHSSTFAPWLRSLSQYNLPCKAPQLLNAVTMSDYEKQDRQNLEHLAFFSIDNQDTKDIDDTIHIQLNQKNHFELTVAIADPSAYIVVNSPLDLVARQRLFSIYLPGFSVPMLPTEITDDICSLKPNQQRAALICRINVDQEGNMASQPYFATAWITSRAKLSYDEVSDYLEKKNQLTINDQSIPQQLTLLAHIAQIRNNWRRKNALLFKDRDDYKFIFNDKSEVINIVKSQRRIANQMVEEAMIMVNYAFAHFITTNQRAIFNTHSGFESKYLDTVIKILTVNKIEGFNKEMLATLDGYCTLRRQLSTKSHIETRILRYQTTAELALKPAPHFGLGFKRYATWTSPLRKYSDLTNHRLLKAILRKESPLDLHDDWLKAAAEKRKQLRLAERDLTNYLYSQFFTDKVNHVFSAQVIDINKNGAKVRLIDNGAVAFMPISLIHTKRSEIINAHEEGCIKINDKILFRIADQITVLLREFKYESHTFIVKMKPVETNLS